ncbi:UDP-forming cellulose synthase catalytic subunit [uncultured Sutterella sp.]|uniref:UDP-forming cellulose synthase catalytic subunit n=1 Tax=uncultured Sutterella sp. TaxID=286133 RepID=UPI002605EFD3|nr:UDP-forming cellulose synthase catalytic subunit [uncultured Sutterella sp.]
MRFVGSIRGYLSILTEFGHRIVSTLINLITHSLERLPNVHRRLQAAGARRRLAVTKLEILVLILLISAGIALSAICVTQPLDTQNQTIFLMLTLGTALLLREVRSHLSLLLLIILSILVSTRYLWWRYSETLNLDSTAGAVCSILLVAAETYAWVVMLLGYFQVFWVLDRKPIPCPADKSLWPHVDVFIPIYNEPLDVIRPTVNAAASMDWPAEKLHVWILDDGSRDEIENFARAAGVGYIRREKHDHAKAGNINHALTLVKGDFVAIFDCDHIPVRSFLQLTMGWMLKDPSIALVQTPHHFYSQDPFTRNLGLTSQDPDENSLFHDLIQKGNDTWNATMFCGSCAVMRRKALDQAGGIAVETVTEDAHTSLRLNRLGWSSAFIGIPLAAGLSTETLSGHVGQRIRWARGMIQIFRTDNPFAGRGLSLGQRLCFLNAMIHFLHGLPRLIFLLAPIPYLFFGIYVIEADPASLFVFVLPHMLHSAITTSIIQRGHRSPFISGVYEAILSWYILVPTTMALISPKLGKFNVTVKGGTIEHEYLDWTLSKPYLLLIGINVAALFFLFYQLSFVDSPSYLTLAINGGWTIYNLIILFAAVAVAVETVQGRKFPRVHQDLPAMLRTSDGRLWSVRLTDYSQRGARIEIPAEAEGLFVANQEASLVMTRDGIMHDFPVIIRRASHSSLGVELVRMTPELERAFTQCTFSRADSWVREKAADETSMTGVMMLFHFAALGCSGILKNLPHRLKRFFYGALRLMKPLLDFLPRPPGCQPADAVLFGREALERASVNSGFPAAGKGAAS